MEREEKRYIKRKGYYERLEKKQGQTINFISALRLISFICGVVFTIIFYNLSKYYISVAIAVFFTIAFVSLIKKYNKLVYNRKCSLAMIEINEESLKRLNGQWKSFEDSGEDFVDENHSYSRDLDIFGKNSLFQYINFTSTYLGRIKLKEVLESPKYNKEEISNRQKAIIELTKNIGWMQRFRAEGRLLLKKLENPEILFHWANDRSDFLNKSFLIIVIRVLPVITIALILLGFMFKQIPYYMPEIAIIVHIIIFKSNSRYTRETLDSVYTYKKDLDIYNKMLQLIEKKNFNDKTLLKFKNNIVDSNNKATDEIKKLEKIVSSISNRNNMAYIPINIITFWDYHCLIALEKWKKGSGAHISKWINTIADIEMLCSLAVTKQHNPNWVIPNIEATSMEIKGKNIGHPLLGIKRVSNDLEMGKKQSIILITGSNMSGKSTFLRTVGINLVLAYTGAAVCSDYFSCPIMNIHTCMRTSDNLEQNTSSFYAELLRIKNVVEAAKSKEPIFFLLDEIFKGTNSKDRHTGAKVLIDKLSKENTLGFVSTHDLELGEMERENNKIKNYHFREYYENDKIYFDYKLKPGISTTRNALYLMKLIGIEIE